MLFADNAEITDPRRNLALEEHLLRTYQTDEDILLFYINEPSIIIGRNQNTLEEINKPYVEQHGIHVVRRLSGGGAVYHDLGNLNFSFITQRSDENFNNFKKFTAPVIRVLQAMGVPAELSGRNDILVEGRKISGNAQFIAADRMVSHGTLLLNSDLSQVGDALNVKFSKIESKGVKSVRSRVANISEYLPAPIDIRAFRRQILEGIFEHAPEIPQVSLTDQDWQAVQALVDSRYATWEWNYGYSPNFNVQRSHRFPSGEVEARLDVEDGLVHAIKFYGDFFGQLDVADVEQRLSGVRYEAAELRHALSSLPVERYFAGLSAADLLTLLYPS